MKAALLLAALLSIALICAGVTVAFGPGFGMIAAGGALGYATFVASTHLPSDQSSEESA